MQKERIEKSELLFVKSLENAGIIKQSNPLTDIMCDGCHQQCIMPVQFREIKGNPTAYIICDKRDNIGTVPVDFSRLEIITFSLAGLALWLAIALPTDRTPEEIEAGSIFYLGKTNLSDVWYDLLLTNKDVNILACYQEIKKSANPLVITLSSPKNHDYLPCVAIHTIMLFQGANITFSKELLTAALLPKAKTKIGAKAKHDWLAYRKQFDDIISDLGLPGIDEPDLRNQAALENKLIEWGEKNFGEAPAPSTMRSHVAKWLK